MSRSRYRTSMLLVLTGSLFCCSSALAQIAIGPVMDRTNRGDDVRSTPKRDSLRGVVGVPVAERLLLSSSPKERLRGVVRLGAIATPEAIDALTGALEQSTIITRDARARLEAIRVLAPHAARENVRALLIRELGEGLDGRASASPLSTLTRGAAALALAKTGEKKALHALMSAVVQGGAGAEAASMALTQYPPESLNLLLEGRRRMDPSIANLLAVLGDMRAQERLRLALAETDPAFQSAAALALSKLGDATPAVLARAWLKTEDSRLRRAGAEVLARLGTTDAAQAIILLLGTNATRSDGVRLAFTAPRKEVITPLVKALDFLTPEDRERAIAAIGRAGGEQAVTALLGQFSKPELATAVAFALARMPGKAARNALEQALASASAKGGAPRRLVVRAAIVRALLLQDEPTSLGASLPMLVAEKANEDRAVGYFGLVATGRMRVRAAVKEVLANEKAGAARTTLLAAIGRASLGRGPEGPAEFAAALRETGQLDRGEATPAMGMLLAVLGRASRGPKGPAEFAATLRETWQLDGGEVTAALGIALLSDPNAEGLSTETLGRLAEEGGPLAPLAARALPSRDGESVRSQIKRLLEGTDPVIRAHIAFGLANDPEPDAVSLLVEAYRFEEDASVRRAVIRALSARKEKQRIATLHMARDLDPDDGVRALAKTALDGRSLLPPATDPAGTVLWVSLVANAPGALDAISGRAARFVRADGLAVPVVSDPDGVLIIPGMPEGRAGLTLAPEAISGDAPSP